MTTRPMRDQRARPMRSPRRSAAAPAVRSAESDAGGLTTAIFYLAFSFLILLVPTAMMGATLPLLVRHSVRTDREIGRRTGVLYATNTAGAVLGTIAAAFVLLPALGLRATIAAAAGVNALVFLAAWALSRSAPALPPEAATAPSPASEPRGRWILALICASGFVSFSASYTRAYIWPTRDASRLRSRTTVCVYTTYHVSSAMTPTMASIAGALRRMA